MSECRLRRHADPLQMWPLQRRGDPVHVLGHQNAAQGRGRVHQQRRAGSQWALAYGKDRGLEEHDRCKWTGKSEMIKMKPEREELTFFFWPLYKKLKGLANVNGRVVFVDFVLLKKTGVEASLCGHTPLPSTHKHTHTCSLTGSTTAEAS